MSALADQSIARVRGLLDDGASAAQPADAWLAAALLQIAGPPAPPDDQELAAYADGGLSPERRAEVDLALLADPELRSSFLFFVETLAALDDADTLIDGAEPVAPEVQAPPAAEAPARPQLRVLDGGAPRRQDAPAKAPAARRGPPAARWMGLAVAALLVAGLLWQLQPGAAPPIDARLLLDSGGPTVRGLPALPAGADALKVVARVPDGAWWAVVSARPATATRGAEIAIARLPSEAAASPHLEPGHVLYEDRVPAEPGEMALFVVVSDAAPQGLEGVVRDMQVRLNEREDARTDFARAAHDELDRGVRARGWRVSKTLHVDIKGL